MISPVAVEGPLHLYPWPLHDQAHRGPLYHLTHDHELEAVRKLDGVQGQEGRVAAEMGPQPLMQLVRCPVAEHYPHRHTPIL